jgi:protein-S-isoprenylcysteine O-methyltransferase Ste14
LNCYWYWVSLPTAVTVVVPITNNQQAVTVGFFKSGA